ncbi:MAG TPA: glycosyltransferase family 39 protein [Burkholderiales bacterium]|nr:glycosyltransferase family 39 protein [Burkholderiales bacterium]
MVTLSPRQWFWGALAVSLAFRLWFSGALPMTVDEAYFVLWGREPALGYYDHPPMVGWLLAPLVQVSEAPWLVRLPSVLLPVALAFLVRSAVARWRDADSADLAGAVVLLAPLDFWNVLITTDTPLVLFSVASTIAFARQRFFLAGVLLGLAFLSKYFAVLLGLGYLVWAFTARRPSAFGLAFLGALPAGLLNLYWNWQACWCNVMFNAINRNEDAAVSWKTPALYAISLAYLAAPLLWQAWKGRAQLRAAAARPEVGAMLAAWLVPFAVFALLSPAKRIGLHWLMAFVPAIAISVAVVLERRALVASLRWFAALAVVHALIFVAILTVPIERWQAPLERWAKPGTYERLRQQWVLLDRPQAVLQPMAPLLARYRLAGESYSTAALLSYDTGRHVPVFGAGSSHARQDDLRTDWRRFDGSDLFIFRREPPELARYRPYFREVEAREFDGGGTRHYAVLGRGFDYAAYREGVLTEIRELWYRIPERLPVGACYFFERYGFR